MVKSLQDKHPEYFEAVLQLRLASQLAINFAENEIKRNRIPLTKVKKVKNGTDYYLADKNFTRTLGRKLQQEFGGQYMVTSSLVGRKKGKDLYRFTILYRGLPFSKGDKVKYNGEEYSVKSISKEILLQEVNTGKKLRVKIKYMKDIKLMNSDNN